MKGNKNYLVALATVAVALSSATAVAGTVKQRGEIKGAEGTKVTLKVVKKGGEIVAVKNFSALGVPARCEQGVSENWEASFGFKGPADVGARKQRFNTRVPVGDDHFRVTGRVRNGGNKVKGKLWGRSLANDSFGECKVPKQTFVTKRR